jgi:hypothetical protein
VAALYLAFSVSKPPTCGAGAVRALGAERLFQRPAAAADLMVPFFKTVSYPLGVFGFIAMTYFVIVGASNAVNFTDGLDGLAIMPVVLVGSALGIFAYIVGNSVYSKYLLFPYIPGAGELLIFCAALAGAGLAFLWFNAHPAQVFMGDVGALALGGALGTIAVITRQEIVLGIMGGVFVAEALSVMAAGRLVQVHQEEVRRGPAHPEDGAAAPPLREEGLGRDPGGGALLDHHHAAVPGRAGQPEAEMSHCAAARCWCSGLGESGLAMARWCAATARPCACGTAASAPPQAGGAGEAVPQAPLRSGALDAARLAGVRSTVLKSPGLAPHDERIAPLLAAARATGIAVQGELDLFARRWPT